MRKIKRNIMKKIAKDISKESGRKFSEVFKTGWVNLKLKTDPFYKKKQIGKSYTKKYCCGNKSRHGKAVII